MTQKPISLRCKFCNSRFQIKHMEKTAVCLDCNQEWNIRWFSKNIAMIISPVSWKAYAQKERAYEGIRKD